MAELALNRAADYVENVFAVGFISALVSEENAPCEELLLASGWAKEEAHTLKHAGITKWSRMIDGVTFHAFAMGIGSMGQTASAIETFAFLTRCQTQLLFLTGIAGSLKRTRHQKADVIVASRIRWRTQNKVTSSEACDVYRPIEHPLNNYTPDLSRVIQKFMSETYKKKNRAHDDDIANWNVEYAEIYSWDYVLSSAEIVKQLNKDFSNAGCVEMEAGGFLAAIERFSQLRQIKHTGFIVKGISDYADHKGADDFYARKAASLNSARVAIDMAEWFLKHDNLPMIA